MCLRLREQCLRSEITSVSRVAHVLLLRLVAGNMDVNTPASKRSQLIGNTAIVRKRCVIYKKSTCVCLRLSVAAFTRKRRDARFDLWPALGTRCFENREYWRKWISRPTDRSCGVDSWWVSSYLEYGERSRSSCQHGETCFVSLISPTYKERHG